MALGGAVANRPGSPAGVVIVGASVAGVRTALTLRRHGHQGPVLLIGEEPGIPYDKPPLSKDALAGRSAPVPLTSPAELAALDVELRTGTRAIALDTAARLVHTDDGREVPYEDLVIATGVQPRRLTSEFMVPGVITLRTAQDADELAAALQTARRLVIVGAGFIGAEVASAARKLGVEVTIVEVQDTPMANLLGPEVGGELARLHAANGVRLITGARVTQVHPGGAGVGLADGTFLAADVVVIGIGTTPATQWLRSSGLPIEDGVSCDVDLRVVGQRHVWAAGDVARRPHPLYEQPVRIEHWTNAGEHGDTVAAGIAGVASPGPQVPYVWSDQYGHRIQIVGRPQTGRLALTAGTADGATGRSLVAVYAGPAGQVVGAVVLDDPRLLMACRRAIRTGQGTDSLREAVEVPVG